MSSTSAHVLPRPSDSLVTSLCREMGQLRGRCQQVMADLGRCREERLLRRLQQELHQLRSRRLELQASVRELRRSVSLRDSLAVAFLDELTRRPLPC